MNNILSLKQRTDWIIYKKKKDDDEMFIYLFIYYLNNTKPIEIEEKTNIHTDMAVIIYNLQL